MPPRAEEQAGVFDRQVLEQSVLGPTRQFLAQMRPGRREHLGEGWVLDPAQQIRRGLGPEHLGQEAIEPTALPGCPGDCTSRGFSLGGHRLVQCGRHATTARLTETTVSIQRCWPLMGSEALSMIQLGWAPS